MAGKKKVTFKYNAPENTHEVKLCGNFTSWEKGCIIMNHVRGAEWKAQVSLEPGEYEYKFLVDDKWYTDPSANRQQMNAVGNENSVKSVR
jgi:hypothetical protein